MNKKGSVIFMYLVVAIAIYAVLYMYINFNDKMFKNTNYIAGDILLDSHQAQVSILTAEDYLDVAAKYSSYKAAMNLEVGISAKKSCLADSGLLVVNQSCNDPVLFKDSYATLVEKYISDFHSKLPQDKRFLLDFMQMENFGHYFLGNVLYIISFDAMSVRNDKIYTKAKPSFELEVPIDLNKLETAYESAKIIDYDCTKANPSDDLAYSSCILSKASAIADSEVISDDDFGISAPLNSFAERWLECVNYASTNCYCELPLNAVKEITKINADMWIEVMKKPVGYDFRVINTKDGDAAVLDSISINQEIGLGNLHSNDYFGRVAIRLRAENNEIKIKVSEPAGTMTEYGSWNSESVEQPLKLVKFNFINDYTLLLTASDTEAEEMLKKIDEPASTSLLNQCAITRPIYLKIKNLGKVPVYNEEKADFEDNELDFVFVFKR